MSKPQILIVDDEESLRLLYATDLTASGYQVDVAAGVREAIAKIENKKYDLILLDIEMPEMSGMEALELLRQKTPTSKLLINSAYNIYKSDFQSWLADDYLVKTSDLLVLKDTIERVLKCPSIPLRNANKN